MRPNGELLPLLRLALPLIAVQVGIQSISLVSTILAGRISAVALGATGLGAGIFFAIGLLGVGIVTGVDPIASQAFGAHRPRTARRALWHGIYIAMLVTLPLSFLILGVLHGLGTFGVRPELAVATREYVYGRLPSLFPFLAFTASRIYLQAAHRTRPILASVLVANVINFLATWILVFAGPRLGIFGLGLGSTLATLYMMIHAALAIRAIPPGPGTEPLHPLDGILFRQVFRLGLPIGFQIFAEAAIFTLVGILAGTLGTEAMASHQVALTLASFTFMVPLAIGFATSVQVGRAIGRGDATGTKGAGMAGIRLGGGFMLVAAGIMWLFPETLARALSSDSSVVFLAVTLIRIAAAFQIFDGVQAVASGALRGAGVTRWAMVVNLIAYWLIALPVGTALMFGKGLGVLGLWWGLTAGLAVAAVALTTKFVLASRRPIAALQP